MDFQDTVPLQDGHGTGGAAAAAPRPTTRPAPGTATAALPPVAGSATRGGEQRLPVRFTGSGSEYFRIWVVNLLLMLVTLGVYYPFAKARRLRYFHANTLIGEHALGFHGDPWKMLRGFALMVVFAGCYYGAGKFSPTASVVAVLAFAALWPALWRASLRFRLANTSWRGLRLHFSGGTADAYRAMLPAIVPMVLLVALPALLGSTAAPGQKPPVALLVGIGLTMLAFVLLSPLTLAWIKRYQHGHYHFAGETSTLQASTSAFYGLWLVTFLITLVPMGLLFAAGAVAAGVGVTGSRMASMVIFFVGIVLFYLSLFFLTQSYFTAKLQNLVWSGTQSPHLRFESTLRARSLAWLSFKNFLLMVVTLGLYRPFAAINMARLRLEALQLQAAGNIEQWTRGAAALVNDASGDAAGDLLGIDVGL